VIVAILGGAGGDGNRARALVKKLARDHGSDLIVYHDDSPYAVAPAVARQCRCSGVVHAMWSTPGNGANAISNRTARDRTMLRHVDVIYVLGTLEANRERVVGGYGSRVERVGGGT